MAESITFPVFVLAKDCGDVMEFPSLQRMQSYMEPIDIENEEYDAWDSTGRLLKLSIGESRQSWLRVESTLEIKNEQDFAMLKLKAKSRERG